MIADDVSCFSDTVIRLQRLIDLIDFLFLQKCRHEIESELNKKYGFPKWRNCKVKNIIWKAQGVPQ